MREIYTIHGSSLRAFWDFVNERHQIYINRQRGMPWPWTKDRILQTYKFTNIFRELDRTTRWMREHVTDPHDGEDPGLMIFNCALFRYFGTMEMSEALGCWVRRYDWQRVARLAAQRLAHGEVVFTGAYMITNCGLAGHGVPKVTMVAREYLQPIWEHRKELALVAKGTNSLRQFCDAIREYKGWSGGGFMAYEVATDLRHTSVLGKATDLNSWCNPGPGALRGLARIYRNKPVKEVREFAVEHIHGILEGQGEYRGKHVPEMEMRDVEHSLCEFDKWCRVKYGEGRPRSRYNPPVEQGELYADAGSA